MSHAPTTPISYPVPATRPSHPTDALRFDWTAIALAWGLLIGAFLDGWAHTHDRVDTSFFTPWHGMLYVGFLTVACHLVGAAIQRIRHGAPWQSALPSGYGSALAGVGLFWGGGVSDLVWHTLFGIEEGVEALVSPPHLLLVGGVWLILSGPFCAAWRRPDVAASSWRRLGPAVLALSGFLSIATFLLQIAHPVSNLWGAGIEQQQPLWLWQEMGVVALLLDTALTMGLVLVALRRWTLPPGSLTVILTLNATAMSVLLYQGYPHPLHIVARTLAGLMGDGLLRWLQPTMERPWAMRGFAFALPALLTTWYFFMVQWVNGLWWSRHLWLGMIVLTGIVGLLLSYVLLPPPFPGKMQTRILHK